MPFQVLSDCRFAGEGVDYRLALVLHIEEQNDRREKDVDTAVWVLDDRNGVVPKTRISFNRVYTPVMEQCFMQESSKKVVEKLSPDEKKQFAADLMLIALSNLSLGNTSLVGVQQSNSLSLDGKAAADVNTMAATIRAATEQKKKQEALLEIKELKSKAASAEIAKNEPAKFAVSRSRLLEQQLTSTRRSLSRLLS